MTQARQQAGSMQLLSMPNKNILYSLIFVCICPTLLYSAEKPSKRVHFADQSQCPRETFDFYRGFSAAVTLQYEFDRLAAQYAANLRAELAQAKARIQQLEQQARTHETRDQATSPRETSPAPTAPAVPAPHKQANNNRTQCPRCNTSFHSGSLARHLRRCPKNNLA